MALIKINGQPLSDLGGFLVRPTLNIEKSRKEPWRASFEVYGYRPDELCDVTIWNSAGEAKIFGGILLRRGQPRLGRGPDHEVTYPCEVAGYEHLLQSRKLTRRFPAQKAGISIREAVAITNPEIDATNVQDGPDLPSFAWDDYPLIMLQRLVQITGFAYWVDADKKLYFQARGSTLAPANLTDTSLNFADLDIQMDATRIRNVIDVRGGFAPSVIPVTDTWVGDGVTANFRMSYEPFSNTKNPLLQDRFSPQADYHPDSRLWFEFDSVNPSPPNQSDSGKAPIVDTDGYILVDNFGFEQGTCQFVGGPGSWTIGILSKEGFPRQEDRYYLATFVVHANGKGIFGFFDGLGIANTDCLHGVELDDGDIHIYEEGVRVPLVGETLEEGLTYSVRVTAKASGGALYEIQGGSYGDWGGRDWTMLHDSETGNAPTLYAGVAGYSMDASVYEVRVADPILGIRITLNGDLLVHGLDGVHTAQVDCLVNAKSQLIRFFTDNRPAEGDVLEATYSRPIPIHIRAIDQAAVDALKAITGETGDQGGWRTIDIKDDALTSREEAEARAASELAQYANPVRTATWQTTTDGYEPHQRVRINLSNRGESREYIIDSVTYEHVNDDLYVYSITAGSTLKGPDDYLAQLIQEAKRVALDPNTPLEFMNHRIDRAAWSESVDRLTTEPDVTGTDTALFTEVVDELALGPGGPFVYGTARYGRSIYS